jgi:hypothetical protein
MPNVPAAILAVPVLVLAAACSQQVYSPPSQAAALGPIRALPQHRQALDVEVSRHAQIFDPGILAGAGRYRVGIGDDTEVSVEGAVLGVDDAGPSTADRSLYTGRVGMRTNPGKGAVALFAGAGGGYAPAGGGFVAVDAGASVGYHNCVLVPVAVASGFVSEPLAPRPIDVTVEADEPMTDTPRRTIGGVLRAGLRLSLAPAACRRGEPGTWLTASVGTTFLADGDTDAGLIGLGVGIEIPLE